MLWVTKVLGGIRSPHRQGTHWKWRKITAKAGPSSLSSHVWPGFSGFKKRGGELGMTMNPMIVVLLGEESSLRVNFIQFQSVFVNDLHLFF